jgi:hypothetical protein
MPPAMLFLSIVHIFIIRIPSTAADVIEELLQVVRKQRNLMKHHVHMLINKNIKNVKLGFGVLEDSYALRFLRERSRVKGKKLKKLIYFI